MRKWEQQQLHEQYAGDRWEATGAAMLITNPPVEILRDARGIYGVGVADEFDYEVIAHACGFDDPRQHIPRTPRSLILRPDRLETARRGHCSMALQMITGGFRHGPFTRTAEEVLRQFIHCEALRRAGLSMEDRELPWWSNLKFEQDRNRKTYHGLRRLSLSVINQMISKAIEAAAEPDAIRTARRFHLREREGIYRAGARSKRAMQLANVFPLAALCLYADRTWIDRATDDQDFGDWMARHNASQEAMAAARATATPLVERGARLRDVAAALEIPMAFRRIKPRVAHIVRPWLIERPDLLRWLPETTPEQYIWLNLVNYAEQHDPEFAEWVAHHVSEIPGRKLFDRGPTIVDLLDWVRSCRDSDQLVTRPFVKTMSLKTVTALSTEWHEAVASFQDQNQGPFPEPWLPAATVGKYEILPLTSTIDLHHEGIEMHHCVASYGKRIRAGEIYVYSVRNDGKRLATVSIGWSTQQGSFLQQVRGPCNAKVSTSIHNAVKSWFLTHRPAAAQSFCFETLVLEKDTPT